MKNFLIRYSKGWSGEYLIIKAETAWEALTQFGEKNPWIQSHQVIGEATPGLLKNLYLTHLFPCLEE